MCSFCGKNHFQVRKMIAGPQVNICDECVELSSDILEGEWEEEREARQDNEPAVGNQPSDRATTFRHSAPCAICHVPQPIEALLAIAERGFLCAACLEAVRRAAEELESS